MGYFSSWQPLVDENAHTALTFGFLRHAPSSIALEPWLTKVLMRPVACVGLEVKQFWPNYKSIVSGSKYTEPEIVLTADDGQPITVVIEAKPGHGQQQLAQITREVIDTANIGKVKRIACIMVAADLGAPMALLDWQTHVAAELAKHDLASVSVELFYASWSSLGHAVSDAGRLDPAWQAYADDVVEQLKNNVLMGYEGAPTLTDLNGEISVGTAAEVFRRTIEAGRQFFLALHSQASFVRSGLVPYSEHYNYRIQRDGISESPTANSQFFETTVLLGLYRLPAWPREHVVFSSIWLGDASEEPNIAVGLGVVNPKGETLVYQWAHSDETSLSDDLGVLSQVDDAQFPTHATWGTGEATWVYGSKPWVAGRPDEDLTWTTEKLNEAIAAWDTRA